MKWLFLPRQRCFSKWSYGWHLYRLESRPAGGHTKLKFFSIKDNVSDCISAGKHRCLHQKILVYFLFNKCEKYFLVMIFWAMKSHFAWPLLVLTGFIFVCLLTWVNKGNYYSTDFCKLCILKLLCKQHVVSINKTTDTNMNDWILCSLHSWILTRKFSLMVI